MEIFRNIFKTVPNFCRYQISELKKTGELNSGHCRISPKIYYQIGWGMCCPWDQTKNWPTGWSNFLCHNWRCIEAPQPFCPSPWDTSISWDVPLPITVTSERSYKQHQTKYVTIKWSLLLGGEAPQSIFCCTWTTTCCCCSSTSPHKPAKVAKKWYTRCFPGSA